MKYEKPEVNRLASALTAIENGAKFPHLVIDRDGPNYPLTNGAYEADE